MSLTTAGIGRKHQVDYNRMGEKEIIQGFSLIYAIMNPENLFEKSLDSERMFVYIYSTNERFCLFMSGTSRRHL